MKQVANATKLAARVRTASGKGAARQTRRDGRVPAVLYGKSVDPLPLSVDAKEAQRLISHVGGHAIIELEVEGAKDKNHTVIIKEVQRDPQKGFLEHLDFHKIAMDEQIERVIALQLVGEPVGAKLGGVLQHGAYEVSVRGVARDIPEVLDVDISRLMPGQIIRISDIALPPGVSLAPSANPDEVVASMLAPRGKGVVTVEAEEEMSPQEVPAEPEVIGRQGQEEE